MTANAPTNAEIVQDFGLAIFGSEWGAGLGRLAGVNQRTMSRIKAAAMDGKEYPAAAGVLAALADAIEAFHMRLAPYRRLAEATVQPPRPAPASRAAPKVPKANPAASVTGFAVPLAGTFERRAQPKKGTTK